MARIFLDTGVLVVAARDPEAAEAEPALHILEDSAHRLLTSPFVHLETVRKPATIAGGKKWSSTKSSSPAPNGPAT